QCGEVFSKILAVFRTFGTVVSTEMKRTQIILHEDKIPVLAIQSRLKLAALQPATAGFIKIA
ncbi:MAG: hypothetical protein Q7T89_06340, partial [Anaerolineales bacterium]|nr:hypothetical protein [Anaerolineales bacterium]